MRKFISVFLVTVLITCFLSGCGLKSVNVTQIKEDLNLRNEIQDCFTSDYVGTSRYEVVDCIIIENDLDKDTMIFRYMVKR